MASIMISYLDQARNLQKKPLEIGKTYQAIRDGYGIIVIEDILRTGNFVGQFGDGKLTISGGRDINKVLLICDPFRKEINIPNQLIPNEEGVKVIEVSVNPIRGRAIESR